MGEDVFDVINLPTTAIRRVLRFLRYPDLRNVAKAIPLFANLCEDECRKVDREVQSRRDFKWTRFASSNDEDSMAPRGLHSMAYHEKECAMYAFGGEAPDWRMQGDSCGPASFNDLWRLDMDELLIYGGCRPLPRHGSAIHLNELHLFNTKKRAYRILATTNDGPNLAGHASCMHGDLFIVHGGVVSTCEGIGRWWPTVGLSPPPSNKNFGGIAVMRLDRVIRLISLGMPQKGSKVCGKYCASH
ncbi:hypothetical protein TELCIR_05277 [Teladorsagia circumcincta]|uniref:F-box domain-containing protein n=1 Tax=Teladorsagia circumcincta TaxID=45464 RepID=A0A2G9UR89_TELCI|nr:hypothetical protein TELCIR_05277 [Teladorsagia circumcincta]